MKLTYYLRNKVINKFNDLVKKDKCEMCGNPENLHVHHVYPFKQMLEDTLEELGYELKEVEEYTQLELRNIREKFLGKHLYYSYKTLCADCHLSKVHKKHKGIKSIKQINLLIDKEILGQWLLKNEVIEKVIVKNNLKNNNGRQIGIIALSKLLKEYGYSMESKVKKVKGKRITHYMITKY